MQAIKEGRAPTHVNIGLRYTKFQELKDNEEKVEAQREKNGNFKSEIEICKRVMGNLKNQKKKGMELYEKLEKDLTQFELEEEEEIAALMANEHLVSDDESDDDNIRIHDDQV